MANIIKFAKCGFVSAVVSLSFLFPVSSSAASELDVIASVIVLEAGGEGREGMKAVACVIQNRARARSKSPYQIVTEPKQFSCLNGKTPSQVVCLAQCSPSWPYALRLAAIVLYGEIDDITHGADHYHAKSMRPYWAKSMGRTVVIGNHVFYNSRSGIVAKN